MTKRPPPALATWLLERCASNYQRDSLVGDLIEQYHQGRTRLWFWKQVAAALAVASTKPLRPTFAVSAARAVLRLTAKSIARKRSHPAIKRLLAAFAAITLTVATLTWASTTTLGSPASPHPVASAAPR